MKCNHSLRIAIQLSAILLLAISVATAQSDYGSITGFVKDPSGAVVPTAKMVVKNEGNGEEHSILTNDSGYYVVPNLQPGYYAATVDATGFKRFVSVHNKLNPNTTLSLDVALTIGSSTESVEVSASNEALQTESGAVQNGVYSQQVDDQELNGRNPHLHRTTASRGSRRRSTLGDFNFAEHRRDVLADQRRPHVGSL